MIIGIGLSVQNSAAAVELYKAAFGLTLGYHVKNPDGSYFHSELLGKDGKEALAVAESSEGDGIGHVQLGFTFEDEAGVRRAYDLLREGGTVITPLGPLPWSPCAADVADRFGVRWFLSMPQHRPPDGYDPQTPWDASMYKRP